MLAEYQKSLHTKTCLHSPDFWVENRLLVQLTASAEIQLILALRERGVPIEVYHVQTGDHSRFPTVSTSNPPEIEKILKNNTRESRAEISLLIVTIPLELAGPVIKHIADPLWFLSAENP